MEIYVLKISDIMEEFEEEQLNEMVPAFRKDIYKRYRNQADRERCLAAGLLLSFCMNQKGVSLMETPSFNKAGKIYFPQLDRFYVNLSHCEDYAACAWDIEDVGIDMEALRMYQDTTARRICTAEETATFLSVKKEEEKNQAFTMLWTRKESVAKLFGEGIAMLFHGKQLHELCEKEGICTKTYTSIQDHYISVSSRKNKFPKEVIVLSPKYLKQWHQQSH